MLVVKALHISLVVAWFAGLFYLPRIFVNLAMVPADSIAERERLLLMAGKLFRGDLLGIGIDALSKCFRGNFAGFDFMQGAFPPSGHAHVGDHLLFYNIIYFQSFGSGNQ